MQRCHRAIALGLSFAAALAAAPAQAQMSLNIGGGLTLPTGELADATSQGFHGLVGVRAALPVLPVHVRVDGLYSRLPLAGFGADMSTVGATAALGYDIVPVGPAKLYAMAGGGYYWSKAEVPGSERVGDIGWNAGAGFRFNLMAAKLFAEARYHAISTEGGTMSTTPISIGITF